MTSVHEHYEQLLGPVYTWMAGGIKPALENGEAELEAVGVTTSKGGTAVDLGAGFGMHAIPLARRGFQVLALDSCAVLLDELRAGAGELPIQLIQNDLQSFPRYLSTEPEFVLCMGDTLTHLEDEESVVELVETVAGAMLAGGRFVVTLRDYTVALEGEQRFIPVRGDANRILTCFLEYTGSRVAVHDILHQWDGSDWQLRVSRYNKLRIAPGWLVDTLRKHGFAATRETSRAGMVRIDARRL